MSLRIIIIVSALALVALVSCDEETASYYPDLSSPYGTMVELEYCFNHNQEADIINRMDAVLSPDFVFYFDPDDVGTFVGDYEIPVSWTKTEMMSAIRNMFNQAHSIALHIPILYGGEDAFGKPDEGDTTFIRTNVTVDLLVMIDESNGYQAQGFCDFEFTKDGSGNWPITTWWDKTGGALLSPMPTPLGIILAMFI